MPRQYAELLLTCENEAEATKIADALLTQRLIVCAKRFPIDARYWWQGAVTNGHEILLLMESAVDLFDEIESEVTKLHSYDTFVLQVLPFVRISRKALKWMEDNLKEPA